MTLLLLFLLLSSPSSSPSQAAVVSGNVAIVCERDPQDLHYSQLFRIAPDIAAAEFMKHVVEVGTDVELLEVVRELPYADVHRAKLKDSGMTVSIKVLTCPEIT